MGVCQHFLLNKLIVGFWMVLLHCPMKHVRIWSLDLQNLNLENWLVCETQRCIAQIMTFNRGWILTERTWKNFHLHPYHFHNSHHRCWDLRANAETQFRISAPQAATKLCWNTNSRQNGKATCVTLGQSFVWKPTQAFPTSLWEPDPMFYGIIWF